MAYIGKGAKKEWITDSICYTPKTNTIQHINSTLTKIFFKRQWVKSNISEGK